MFNKKSKASAVLTTLSSLLLLLTLLALPIMMATNLLSGEAALIFAFTLPILIGVYVLALIYIIIAFVFSGKIKKEQDKAKLISLNKRIAIGSIVLAPFIAFGLYYYTEMLIKSPLGNFSIALLGVVALLYIVSIIVQFSTASKLKKMPDEAETPAMSVDASADKTGNIGEDHVEK